MSCVRHYRYPSTCRTRSGRRGMDGALTPFSCLVRHRAVFRPVGTSRRTSASFPEKGRSETPDRVRRPPGNMASGRVWRAKPAILLHAGTPKPCVGPARPRTRSSARLGRASVRPGLASESGRGRLSNQPSNSTACGNYLHVSLFFGNFAIMTDRVHVLRVFHTCAPVAEYTRKRG